MFKWNGNQQQTFLHLLVVKENIDYFSKLTFSSNLSLYVHQSVIGIYKSKRTICSSDVNSLLHLGKYVLLYRWSCKGPIVSISPWFPDSLCCKFSWVYLHQSKAWAVQEAEHRSSSGETWRPGVWGNQWAHHKMDHFKWEVLPWW